MKKTLLFTAFLLLNYFLQAQNWTTLGSAGFSGGLVHTPAMATYGSDVYVAYVDQSTSPANKVTVMQWNGSSWTALGGAGITSSYAIFSNVAIAITSTGTPYIAFADTKNSSNPGGISVMYWNGSSWSYKGSAAFSSGPIYGSLALAFDKNNTPYVAFSQSSGLYVMSFSGSSWSYVGGSSAIDLAANGVSLAIDQTSGNPTSGYIYLAYTSSNDNFLTVQYNTGSSWSPLGKSQFAVNCSSPSLAIPASNDGTVSPGTDYPYLYYIDGQHNNRPSTVFFDGYQWVPVGLQTYVSTGAASTGGGIVSCGSGTPVVAFTDVTNGSKATVMSQETINFVNSDWTNLNNPDFSASNAYSVCIAADDNCNIYVGYVDESTTPVGKLTVMKSCASPGIFANLPADCPSSTCNILQAVYPCSTSISSYQWYNGSSPISGATSSTYTPSSSGSYNLSITNSTGCTSMTSQSFYFANQTTLPTPSITPSGSVSFGAGSNGTLNVVNPTPNYTYQWYNGSTPVSQPWADVGNAGFSVTDLNLLDLALYTSGGTVIPCVAYSYEDVNGTHFAASRYLSNSWQSIGSTFTLNPRPDGTYLSLAVSSSGTPYISINGENTNITPAGEQFNVYEYTGSSWTFLSGAGTPSDPGPNSLAINSSGTPYFAFSYSNEVTGVAGVGVQKYSGGSWTNVGSVPFTPVGAGRVDLALNESSVPYVVFIDGYLETNQVSVMKYTGTGSTGWQFVGTEQFSALNSDNCSIALNSCGQPYVAFSEGGDSDNKLSVMTYTGNGTTGWEYVGTAGFSAGAVSSTSIAINPNNGLPYVSYKEATVGATVAYWNGSNWLTVGSSGFAAAGESSNGNSPESFPLAMDAQGNAYVGYIDNNNSGYATVMINNQQNYTPTASGSYSVAAYSTCAASSASSVTTVTIQNDAFINTPLASSYGAGDVVNINYTAVGSYTSGNVFTAQLSDASGSFASPVNIGSVTATTSGTISATIPSTPDGSNYQIRIVSSTPPTTGPGSDNISICANCRMALSFSSGDRVKVPANSAYNFGTGDFTMEAWVNLPPSENYGDASIISNRTSGTNGFLFAFASSTGNTNEIDELVLQLNGSNYYSNTFYNIDNNTCHHVAVTRASGAITFYLDGTAIGTGTSTASISSTNPLFIGFDTIDESSDSFLGNLDDIRLWNIAESPSTIAANMTAVVPGNSTGLVGYWDFNESGGSTVYDQSATDNNGYFETGTTSPSRVLAKCFIPALESGLAFSGSERATVPNNSAYNFGSGKFTIEAWVNLLSQTGTAPGIASTRSSSSNGFLFSTLSGNDLLLQMGGTNYYSHGFTNIEGTGCHHIAVASNGSGALQFYLDGSALGGTIPCSTSISSTGPMYIGYDAVNTTTLNGSINEVVLWDTTRTATQVASDMNAIFPSGTTNLIGYWKFNEVGDQTIYDASSTANNGYLGNSQFQYSSLNPTRTTTTCFSGDRLAAMNETGNIIDSSSYTNENQVKVYPNPSTGILYIQVDQATQASNIAIAIYNSVGELVYNTAATAENRTSYKVDLSNKPSGLYIVEVTADDKVTTQKVIIQN